MIRLAKFVVVDKNIDLHHHGILGQKWGKRNGPPYPLKGGSYSSTEVEKISAKRLSPNSIYNKKHYDEVLKADKTTLSTLSYDKDRTKDVDMFYATHTALDKNQYNALFNSKIKEPITDENGNSLGTGNGYKFKINNKISEDMKIASEDSGADTFMELWQKDRDFYNFVMQPDRMESHFVASKYKFKGYREAKESLDNIRKPNYEIKDTDLKNIYRMFNYVIPSDGGGDARRGKDVQTQRAKFFKSLKDKGYGAVIDTNDAIYGSFKAKSPVIVFDMDKVIPDNVKETSATSKVFSFFVYSGRKVLHA